MTQIWQVPEPLNVLTTEVEDGTRITVRQHGNPNGTRLLLSHGNGLAIDLYYPFWSLLEDDFELLVYDLRNHGWNQVANEAHHNLVSMVTDLDHLLSEIDDAFGSKPSIGVFHSLSALIALLLSSEFVHLLSSKVSKGFDRLILFDPPLHSPGKSHVEFDIAVERTARVIRKRSEKFDSLEQFAELLEFFPTYSRLVPGARELMASAILRPAADQTGYELRCPRDYEARVVDHVRAFSHQSNLIELPCPTKIVGADPLLPFAYLPTVDLSEMANVDFDFIPETTHFMQIENPSMCAEFVREFVKDLN